MDLLKSYAYVTFKTVDIAEIKISLNDGPLLKCGSGKLQFTDKYVIKYSGTF